MLDEKRREDWIRGDDAYLRNPEKSGPAR